MEQQERKLVKKLAEVMQAVKYIQKRGYNKAQDYSYPTESDVVEKIREELAKRFVILTPNLIEHQIRERITTKYDYKLKKEVESVMYIHTVKMEFTFEDGETGETRTFKMGGEGIDSMDKGLYKAFTGAEKYALMKFFMIPTGDDPERENELEKEAKEEPAPVQKKTQPKGNGQKQQTRPTNEVMNDLGAWKALAEEQHQAQAARQKPIKQNERGYFFKLASERKLSDIHQKLLVYGFTGKKSRADVTNEEYHVINNFLERSTMTEINQAIAEAQKAAQAEKEKAADQKAS